MNTTEEKTQVLCFTASPETAQRVDELRIRKKGIVSRSEVLGELVEIGLKRLEEVATLAVEFEKNLAGVERETTSPKHQNTVPSASHTRSSKRSMERSTRKSAGTADSK